MFVVHCFFRILGDIVSTDEKLHSDWRYGLEGCELVYRE